MIIEISHRCRGGEHNSFLSILFYLIIVLILDIPTSLFYNFFFYMLEQTIGSYISTDPFLDV